jgi:cellulose synthase/poly-beta-1,6-N-acetylglucosamine synthase-like glycosyltransferase
VLGLIPYLLLALAFVLDFQNVASRWGGRTLSAHFERLNDFTIVVPIWGDPRYFENRRALARWKANVLVALDVTNERMALFADELAADGWRVARVRHPQPNPPVLIDAVLSQVTTTYVARMDADTRPLEGLDRFVARMAADGADLCSTKVRVASPRTRAQKLQDLEYAMSMLSRHFRPWLTSGACFVARTDALRRIFERHSMWFPGEDIETGRIAHALRMRVRHLDMTVETDAPEGWGALFRQRRLWWAGSFRHAIVNFDKNVVQLPVWTLYTAGFVFASAALKWHELLAIIRNPVYLVSVLWSLLVVYAVVTLIANFQVRSWRMLVFPAYALAQIAVMPAVGAVAYAQLAWSQRTLGRYRFGLRRVRRARRGGWVPE